MILKVKLEHLKTIKKHSLDCYPEECCGLLLGKINAQEKIVVKVIPTENDWENQQDIFTDFTQHSERSNRNNFSISPQILVKIQQQARQENLDIIGVYHSHPDHPAIPSNFDKAIAWQTYSYIIVSVTAKETKKLLNWSLNSQGNFEEEKMIIDE